MIVGLVNKATVPGGTIFNSHGLTTGNRNRGVDTPLFLGGEHLEAGEGYRGKVILPKQLQSRQAMGV